MPAKIQVACRVSSRCSKHSSFIEDGSKRRRRNKIDGVVMRSMEGRKWEVLWGGGVNQMEVCFGNGLKFEGLPDDDTKRLVEWHKGERRCVSLIVLVVIVSIDSYLFISFPSSFRVDVSEILGNAGNSSAEGRRPLADGSTTSGTLSTTTASTLPFAPPEVSTVPPAASVDRTVAPPPVLAQVPMPALDNGPEAASVLLSLAAGPAVVLERALVPVAETNQTLVSLPEGGIAGQNFDSESEEELDPDDALVGEDDENHVLPDYIYEDAALQEVMSHLYGLRRKEVEMEKLALLGSITVAHGNEWRVRTDVTPEDIGVDATEDDLEDYVEKGIRSKYLGEQDIGLPQTARVNHDVMVRRRTSPRNKKTKERMDECKVMFEYVLALYPVPWHSFVSIER